MRIRIWVALAFGLVGLTIPVSASAAVRIGEDTSAPGDTAYNCGSEGVICTFALLEHPSRPVTAPFDGVIVRWRVRGQGGTTGQLKLRVLRGSEGSFTGAGTSAPETVPPGVESVFASRLPIKQGDYIGLDVPGAVSPPAVAARTNLSGASWSLWEQPLGDGESPPRPPSSTISDESILYNADIEPDADADGFGDETQDNCQGVSNPGQEDADGDGIGDPCEEEPDKTPPDTGITNAPPDKTKNKTATFGFTGTDARAVASFQCKLDASSFLPCISPYTVTVKKGKHTFQVQAIDQAGNVDPTPATDSWKVKKKHKK